MKYIRKQKLGLVFALCACILFWLPIYSVNTFFLFFPTGTETISLIPNFASGLFSLVVVFLLYMRGIISFKTKKTRLVSILINWSLLATFFEILVSPVMEGGKQDAFVHNIGLLICAVLFMSILLFGVREIAKIVFLIFILGSFFSNLMVVSESMGVLGFIALALIIISFYLQGNIHIKTLETETRYLFGNTPQQTIHLVDSAKKEARTLASKMR